MSEDERKAARLEAQRRWRAKNPEKTKAQRLRARANRKERDAEYQRQWRAKNPDKLASQQHRSWINNRSGKLHNRRQYYEKRPHRRMLDAAKGRAKRKNIEFTISEKDIVINDFCPWLGLRLVRNKGRHRDNSPSLDRVDNTLGYVPGNIEVISQKANFIKNTATLDDLVLMGRRALKLRSQK
jgi:hypothetical protein